MASLTVRLEWDGDDLGPYWMNPDNLKALLYGDTSTRPDLLTVCVVEQDPDTELL